MQTPFRTCVSGALTTVAALLSPALAPANNITIQLPASVPMVLTRIPAGTFQMGSPDTELSRLDSETLHQVTLTESFFIGKFEVTQQQWLAVMDSWPGEAPTSGMGLGDDFPAYKINWNDAQAFVTALSSHLASSGQGNVTVSLPTEAQWEYACRAGTTTRFSFGDGEGLDDSCSREEDRLGHMWYCGNNLPVGAKRVGRRAPNGFGLHDMHGNAYEWCQDWYGPYPTTAVTDPTGPANGSFRCFRGGSFQWYARDCRSARRQENPPEVRATDFGFRIAARQTTPTATRPAVLLPAFPPETTQHVWNDIPVRFTQSVTGLAIADFAVTGGTASDLKGSGASYTIDLTFENVTEIKTVQLPGNKVTGSEGLGNSPSHTVEIDYTAHGIAINSVTIGNIPSPTTETFFDDVPITFSFAVTGLQLSHFFTFGVELSDLKGSGDSYSVDVTLVGGPGTKTFQLLAIEELGNEASRVVSIVLSPPPTTVPPTTVPPTTAPPTTAPTTAPPTTVPPTTTVPTTVPPTTEPPTSRTRRKVLIVAGGGDDASNTVRIVTRHLSQVGAYLSDRRNSEGIRLLTSHAHTSAERYPSDGAATIANLLDSITNWASDADNLTIILIGQGKPLPNAAFVLDGWGTGNEQLLPPSMLDGILDLAQSGNDPLPLLTVVVESSFSGAIIKGLAPDNGGTSAGTKRILISSTGENQVALYGAVNLDGVTDWDGYLEAGETVSFSSVFFASLYKGASLKKAYEDAATSFAALRRIDPNIQKPVLDDSGNGIGGDPEDGGIAAGLTLGRLSGAVVSSTGGTLPDAAEIGDFAFEGFERQGDTLRFTLTAVRPLTSDDGGAVYLMKQQVVDGASFEPVVLENRVLMQPLSGTLNKVFAEIPKQQVPDSEAVGIAGYFMHQDVSPLLPSSPYTAVFRTIPVDDAIREVLLKLREGSTTLHDDNSDGALDSADLVTAITGKANE